MSSGFELFSGITGLVGGIICLIVLIAFFILCSNVSQIRQYMKTIYRFELIRMMEDGKIEPKTQFFTNWTFKKRSDDPISRTKKQESTQQPIGTIKEGS
jgi:hypothetical protein